MKKLPEDLFTHKRAWRKALECQHERAVALCDHADIMYWQHELNVFDRVWKELESES